MQGQNTPSPRWRILDDGLDELAASAFAGFYPRIAVTLITLSGLTMLLPWRLCLALAGAIVGGEVWSWFATRKQAHGRPAGPVVRACHLVGLATVTAGWLTMGALLWNAGSTEGAISAAVIWLAVLSFAQTSAYQSPSAFAVGGVAPAIGMLAIVFLGPNPAHLRLLPIGMILVLALCFLGDGAGRMIAARRRLNEAQARLKDSEGLYRLLADNVTDVIALSGVKAERIYISPSVEQALGYTVEELFRTPNYSYVYPEDSPALRQAVAEMVERRGAVTADYRVVHKDGTVFWVQTNFTYAEGAEPGAPPRIVSMSRNIQARKELDAELIEAREAAEAAAAAKSDFLANMTHELRTPLNAIIGFTGLLQASSKLEGGDRRHAELIGHASQTLLDLVNSVLDFSRLEADAVELDPTPFDPAAEVAAMAAIMEGQAAAKGLDLIVRSGLTGRLLNGDAKRIRQILLNFLSNAIKFTANGQVTIEVERGDVVDGAASLRLAVSDSGIGLATSQIDHIFGRFTQADVSVSRQFGGAGLGLAISKRIAELMGGRVGATSVQGQGSTFWFEVTLPVAAEAAAETESDAPAVLERPIRLLLVEDVAVNRELVQAILSPFDIQIETAENGVEAIEAFSIGAYDLVLMDVQMPVMDGLTAAGHIRRLPVPTAEITPIIAMTANVLPDQIAKCIEAGMDDHLGKPMNPAALLQAITHWTSVERTADQANEPAAQIAGAA